jgi:hypothetical protein
LVSVYQRNDGYSE